MLLLPLCYYSWKVFVYASDHKVAGIVNLGDYWMLVVGGVVYQVTRYVVMTVTAPWHTALCGKKDPAQRARYIKKATEASSKVLFHSVAFTWGWWVLKESFGLPWMLGGTIDMHSYCTEWYLRDWPLGSPPRSIIAYGLYCGGYHLSEFIRHLIHERHRGDFYEMLLHHILTVALIACYIISNSHMIGVMIAVLHDAADIWISLARIVHSTKYDNLTAFLFIAMVLIWIWTRLSMLPYSVYLL